MPAGHPPRRAAAVAGALLAVIVASAFWAAPPSAASSGSQQPWRVADRVASDTFEAREQALLAGSGEATQRALAADRGRVLAALRAVAFSITLQAAAGGDVAVARRWLLVREFRKATRFTRPGINATAALEALASGDASPEEAGAAIEKDLLDAYQARLMDYLDDAATAHERGFDAAAAESASLAAGYWRILAPTYTEQNGPDAAGRTGRAFDELARAAEEDQGAVFARAHATVLAALDGFTAAAFTDEEQARRANQLLRFLDLIPVEYDHGTDDGRVTIPFELQEGLAFVEGAQSALLDLSTAFEQRDPAALATLEEELERLGELTLEASQGGAVASQDEMEATYERARAAFDTVVPEEWTDGGTEADFDLVQISLDQMQAAFNAGQAEQAEQARLSAYAFFEFGPELQLRALDPQLTAEIEGLVWYGARGYDGLAEVIAGGGSEEDLRETRLALDESLQRGRDVLGDGASEATVITNAALIVFREGLEAVLIIAAITASMIGASRALRRPIYRGALLALPACVVLWVLAQTVLQALSRYGEKLEAVVGLIAIAVLLLVLNWFFHRVYWTQWIAGHRRRGKALAGVAAVTGASVATVAGLYLLGFTSVLREGFETVLFLQALELNAGAGVVLAGVGLGLALTAVVGAATFMLERKLPYKKMLIVTGVLISLVLVVMVGNTARTLQGVGWISITPIDVTLPLWMGTWLGISPTVETIGAQIGALAFVVGSYLIAERVRRGPRRPRSKRLVVGPLRHHM